MTDVKWFKQEPSSFVFPETRLLSLWQPWASLIAIGLKQEETRPKRSNYRGRIAIQAAKRKIDEAGYDAWLKARSLAGIQEYIDPQDLPTGCIVAVVDQVGCRKMTDLTYPGEALAAKELIYLDQISEVERAAGDWRPGRYAWSLTNARALSQPIPIIGTQGLRRITDEAVLEAIEARLVGGVSHG